VHVCVEGGGGGCGLFVRGALVGRGMGIGGRRLWVLGGRQAGARPVLDKLRAMEPGMTNIVPYARPQGNSRRTLGVAQARTGRHRGAAAAAAAAAARWAEPQRITCSGVSRGGGTGRGGSSTDVGPAASPSRHLFICACVCASV